MKRLITVSEPAIGDDTPKTRRQLKRVISTTPAPEGVNGKADASSGIIVRKTASVKLFCKSNAAVKQNIQKISNAQMITVRAEIGNNSLALGHIPVWKAWIIF